MLFVTVFTFIGLPSANSYLSMFGDFGIENFNLDFTEEEERESSKNETKELENKLVKELNSFATFQCNKLNSIAIHENLATYSSLIKEVTTPPPEQLIV